MQNVLSATYPAPISTIFEIKDVSWVSEFLCRGFPGPQNSLKLGTFKGMLVRGYSSNSTIWGDGYHLWGQSTSKGCAFLQEFWWGTYGLGHFKPM